MFIGFNSFKSKINTCRNCDPSGECYAVDAYPVITTDSIIHIEKMKEYLLTIKNLHLVGRNSDFEYIHTHDIMRRSRLLVNKMVSL